jgi:flagellar hook-basal body complex protein FliE
MIQSIKPMDLSVIKKADSTQNAEAINFKQFLSDAIDTVNSAEKTSNQMDQMMAAGDIENIHDAMIAAQKAEITLNFAIQINNKVIDAYKELMRIQL